MRGLEAEGEQVLSWNRKNLLRNIPGGPRTPRPKLEKLRGL